MILEGIIFVIVILLLVKQIQAIRKTRHLKNARAIIHTDVSSTKPSAANTQSWRTNLGESAFLSAGSMGISLLDIYSTTANHSQILDVIEQRYPHAIGGASPMEWFSKVESLFKNDSVGTYVDAYAGQAGENAALELLRNQGFDAHLFESRNHVNDDIFVHLHDGSEIDYSVKSGSAKYVIDCLNTSPSTHYIINSEAYNDLYSRGLILSYHQKGIDIVDGHFSNNAFHEAASGALYDVHDAGDLAHDIPFVALAFFGAKTWENAKQFFNGAQSGYELGINVTGDLTRIGARGIAAFGGAKVGAAIGSFIAPGVGTLIGGGVGVLAASIGTGQVFERVKNWIKWGNIIKAISHFGNKYRNGLTLSMQRNIGDSILGLRDIEKEIVKEESLYRKYKKPMNPYSIEPVTLSAILCCEYLNELKSKRERIIKSTNTLGRDLFKLIRSEVIKSYPNVKPEKRIEIAEKYFGEIIVANQNILLRQEYLTVDEDALVNAYNEEIKRAPNHPFKFNIDSEEVLVKNAYANYVTTPNTSKMIDRYNVAFFAPLFAIILITISYMVVIF